MKIYNENDFRSLTNNRTVKDLEDEVIKCVPYTWILINHYQIRKYIEDNKLTDSAMEKTIIPFEVDIKDKYHPHVYKEGIGAVCCYKRVLAVYRDMKEIVFRDRDVVFLNLKELMHIVFNKSCTKNLRTRMLSDADRKERNSSEIILDLKNSPDASIIKNSADLDMVLANVYAETVYKLTYVGKAKDRPEWLYPYPETVQDMQLMKEDACRILKSLQREVKKTETPKYANLLDDGYKVRR